MRHFGRYNLPSPEKIRVEVSVPCGKVGQWEVYSREITKEEAQFTNLRYMMRNQPEGMVVPGMFTVLKRGDTVVMSNTPFEVLTNQFILQRAHGRILINGFGIGMVTGELLKVPEVEYIRIIELDEDVIRLVGPHYGLTPDTRREVDGVVSYATPDGRLEVIIADAMEYRPAKGERFNTVWHDIWDTVCSDNLEDMKKLTRRYARRCDAQHCWARELIKRG